MRSEARSTGYGKLRNELAHDGKLKEPLTEAEAAPLLAAALLTHRYATLLVEQIQP
jgi:hypothetical protein